MILVTSAAGNTGRIVVDFLVNKGLDVLATDLNPAVHDLSGIKASETGDLTDLNFLNYLLSKVDQVVYIPPLFSSEETLIGKRMIDIAIKRNIKQFVFISVIYPILTSLLQHVAKRDVEEYLIYKGMSDQLPYTILQPMHYMHNFDPKKVAETHKYQTFYDIKSKVAYVDTKDIAQVVVKVLSDPKKFDKGTYELVGTPAYSPNDLVRMFNQVTGQRATAEYVPVIDFLDQIGATDLYFREGFKHLAASYTKWGLDGNSQTLTWLLGREPTSFKTYIKRALNLK
ncbi:NmrA family NAD(P)-binding protein [Lactobacillus sp. CC-MHH1034]|uniref:SDR family oxidoreductase n=1 Tax=Agrilactobacillus fermenti TaxID=2586909 RepID=UPI001E2A56BC|nr:NmrA family NAD(P)-binding protein [Agrilactobacillus fermenti]MCD2257064.1 NmrA family NAD(P)-binding protein [Agrilactobacillus fermenti]